MRMRALSPLAAALALAACNSGGPPERSRDPVPVASGALVDGWTPEAERSVSRIDSAIASYAADRAGRLPLRLEDLVAEKNPDGDAYLRALPKDPWGRPYSYRVLVARLGRYDLRSYGPDGLGGTADDVVSVASPVGPR
jgi:general secretion pathway protein G